MHPLALVSWCYGIRDMARSLGAGRGRVNQRRFYNPFNADFTALYLLKEHAYDTQLRLHDSTITSSQPGVIRLARSFADGHLMGVIPK